MTYSFQNEFKLNCVKKKNSATPTSPSLLLRLIVLLISVQSTKKFGELFVDFVSSLGKCTLRGNYISQCLDVGRSINRVPSGECRVKSLIEETLCQVFDLFHNDFIFIIV